MPCTLPPLHPCRALRRSSTCLSVRAGASVQLERYRAWRAASVFQHLHRLGQALAQAPERFGQDADLVTAARAELGHVQLAQADAIGELGQTRHRPDDDVLEHEIE